MFFRPNYCCNCGERIEVSKWDLKASRKFCTICKSEFVFEDWLPATTVLIALGCVTLAVGGYFSGDRIVRRNPDPKAAPQVEAVKESEAAGAEKPLISAEVKADEFVCGVRTKKGTRCTRRVSSRGEHCWQHRNQTSRETLPKSIFDGK